jgi:hypothetical protein
MPETQLVRNDAAHPLRELAPVLVRGAHIGRESELDRHRGHRDDPPHRPGERHVVDVDRCIGLRPIGVDEAQRHR